MRTFDVDQFGLEVGHSAAFNGTDLLLGTDSGEFLLKFSLDANAELSADSDTSVSAEQTGNVDNNTSDISGNTGNGSTGTTGTEDQSSNVNNTPAQTSGSGAADKFLLLFLICFLSRKRSKI